VTDVRTFGETSAADCTALAAALESVSEHVLARAFVTGSGARLRAEHAEVEAGCGVEATVGGRRLRLGRRDWVREFAGVPVTAFEDGTADATASVAWLAEAGRLLARFTIGDALRDDAAESVAALQALGHRVGIASGDREAAVAAVAAKLGVPDWHAGLTPAAKLEHLQALRRAGAKVVMVGDGINDAPVLSAADASIAVDAGTALARASADVVVPGRRLSSVVRIAETAVLTRRIIRQNVGWAIGYNLCAVPLAVAGLLAPWMAAIGMSLSSLLVVGNALRLQRAAPPAAAIRPPQAAPRARRTAAT
jgi:Cu2+-exporting ATPase